MAKPTKPQQPNIDTAATGMYLHSKYQTSYSFYSFMGVLGTVEFYKRRTRYPSMLTRKQTNATQA